FRIQRAVAVTTVVSRPVVMTGNARARPVQAAPSSVTGWRRWRDAAIVRLEPIAIASLSLGAAAIHFGVISEHFAEYALFGLFFSVVGWFEALWAIAYVLQPARAVALVGVVGSAGTVGVWIWAHVVGLPFGPDAGSVEPTTVLDLTATLFESL